MPVNYITVDGIVTGMILLPPNGSRVLLVFTFRDGSDSQILVGDDMTNGIIVPVIQSTVYILRYNEVGSVMQGPVWVFFTNSTYDISVMEVWRLPDGTT